MTSIVRFGGPPLTGFKPLERPCSARRNFQPIRPGPVNEAVLLRCYLCLCWLYGMPPSLLPPTVVSRTAHPPYLTRLFPPCIFVFFLSSLLECRTAGHSPETTMKTVDC